MLKASALAGLLIFTPALTAREPGGSQVAPPKAPVKKVITVERVKALSMINEYTVEEEQLLEMVSKSPKKTRDALVNMHVRRIKTLSAIKDTLVEQQRHDDSAYEISVTTRHINALVEGYKKLKDLAL